MARPSHKELSNKLKLAREKVSQGKILLIKPEIIVADALELNYSVEADLQTILLDLIDNTSPKDYVGDRPPQKSYENDIKDLDLFAFKSRCSSFTDYIYLKFALTDTCLFIVSLHKHREQEVNDGK